ncbi:ABC transporter substrate binding protein [Clostridium grantii]|uniref:Diguanylate cyclase (GGDEF) domain-containing protein n=1 Tax=Clostridium grantii DSM 8605 TaxID=1121316 RepID=A0A1M5X329_9CLOT|nr:ABC transporter substrate binding protein [Clostridium grantii]SHH94191.1 diguanylate cyclase (GGDEF) domain-containing protein [Clostridium grantii DSM 8605]
MIKNKIKIINYFIVLIIVIMIISIFSGLKVKAIHTKRILLISSYNYSFPTFQNQIEGVKSQLNSSEVLIDVEFMDFKRFETETNLSNFYNSLKYKLEQLEKYELVIVTDDNALDFAMEYNEELFKDTPIVFLGINNHQKAVNASINPNITGVEECISMFDTIDIATKLNKGAKKIIALSDGTETSRSDLELYYTTKKEFQTYEFTDINLSEMTFEEFYGEIEQINKDDIVLLLSAYTDKLGNDKSFNESLELINESCQAPIYHLWEHGIGEGVLGGKVISHYEQGKRAGKIVNSVLNGESIKNYPLITEENNKYIFDVKKLEENNISMNLLPKNTILINEKISFYENNKKIVNRIIALFIFLSLLIIYLMTNIHIRKKHEKELLNKNEELNDTFQELAISQNELKRQYSKIHKYAYYDNLTGLTNRTSLKIKLRNLTQIKTDYLKQFAVIFLDLDNFKFVNDSYGHSIGDKVLKEIAKELIKLDLGNSSIYRLGGDEFVLILEDYQDTFDLNYKTDKLRKTLDRAIDIEGNKYFITASIGVAIYPQNGKNYSELLKNADAAMYKAKENGKNCSAIYDESINAKLNRNMEIRSELVNAFTYKEFFLNFQPQIDIESGRVYGFEALIRWINPKLGFVSPGEFIEVAEEMGRIVQIGNWVLKESCIFCKKINEKYENKLIISVNVSAVQLMQKDFLENIKNILEKTEVDPKLVAIEITETAVLKNFDLNRAKLEQIKSMGIKVSLDDFGKGYSSLYYLRNLPIDTLKIDKSFIDDIITNDNESTIKDLTESIILIAHKVGLKVIAEGVEMPMQLMKLKEYKCDFMQGYYVSKPIEEKLVCEFLKKFEENKGEYKIWN